jgi:NAD/NADP transhydrogenase beta subunit
MTAMPQLVAIFNGVGGGAASLVSITEFVHIKSTHPATYVILEVLLGVLIGTVSFSGSAIAFAKLPRADDRASRHVPGPADHERPHRGGRARSHRLRSW